MKNGQNIQGYNDRCPIHGAEEEKTYNFGRFSDATVTTFTGCNCAICQEMSGFDDPPQYYTDYNGAAGRARMIQQGAQ